LTGRRGRWGRILTSSVSRSGWLIAQNVRWRNQFRDNRRIGLRSIDRTFKKYDPSNERRMHEARENKIAPEPFFNRAHLRVSPDRIGASFGGDSSCVSNANAILAA
jgi:hypothetical protein